MSGRVVYFNGRYVPENEARVSIFDSAVMYGDMAFEIRAVTMELARDAGIEVRETNLGRYEALMADEIFCTATTYSLVHATTFEGQTIGDGKPGPVFQRLSTAWKELTGVDFVDQAHEYARRLPDWEKEEMSSE